MISDKNQKDGTAPRLAQLMNSEALPEQPAIVAISETIGTLVLTSSVLTSKVHRVPH